MQAQLKQALDAALAEAKKAARPGQVDVRTGNFSLYPRYARRQRHHGWQGSAELVVEGRDMAAIGQLAGRIATMTIASVGYRLSREASEKVESEVAAEAIARYRAKAGEYAKQFGYAGYAIREVNVSSERAESCRCRWRARRRCRSSSRRGAAGRARQGDRDGHGQRHGPDEMSRRAHGAEPRLRHVQCLARARACTAWRTGNGGEALRCDPRACSSASTAFAPGPRLRHPGARDRGDFRVVCPDVVGRGDSDRLADPTGYQVPAYVADMVTLLARLDAETVHWVGTSMGGLIGMALASLPQSPIARLVLNDVGPTIDAAGIARIGSYVGPPLTWATLTRRPTTC